MILPVFFCRGGNRIQVCIEGYFRVDGSKKAVRHPHDHVRAEVRILTSYRNLFVEVTSTMDLNHRPPGPEPEVKNP